MTKDSVGALGLLLIALGYYYLATDINQSALADEIGAAGLPVVYAALLAGLALGLALKAVIAQRRMRSDSGPEQHSRRDNGRTLGRAAGMLVIGIGYLACIAVMGYVVSLAGLIGLVALYLGERAGWRLAGIATGGAIAFWVLFDRLLGIEMPVGLWTAL